MHKKPDAEEYYRINDAENKSEIEHDFDETEGERKDSRKRCIMIILLICVFAAAILALILVLVLKSEGDKAIPKGYNGYTIVEETDNKWNYEALFKKTKVANIPVPVDTPTNPESKNLMFRVSMMNDQTFRIKVNPVSSKTDL